MKKYLVLLIVFFATNVFGATYYVSTTGSDSAGNGSKENPWRTPVYGASRLTSPGDILYIRGGTYVVSTSNSPNQNAKIVPAANNCTIAGYPGETAILKGNCGAGAGVAPTCGVIGSFNGSTARDYTTIDNLTIEGVVVMFGKGITLKNSDVSVGGDGWPGTQQGEVVWLSWCTNCLIQNNKLHDNTVQDAGNNNSLIMEYSSHSCIIEYNSIFNSAGSGLALKDTPDGHKVRYNYFYDNAYSGVYTANQATASGSQIYQNIFRNNNTINNAENGGISLSIAHTNLNIYNNTFYQNYVADINKWTNDSSLTFYFFNNISASPRSMHLTFPYSSSSLQGSMLYCDYNAYHNDVSWRYRTNTYSTLSSWRTACQALLTGCDANSVTSNPEFVNASGTFTMATDFKRRVYSTNGRGGLYPIVMGAYITGNEIIGSSIANKASPPSAPRELKITR